MRVILAAIFVVVAIFVYDAWGRPNGTLSVQIQFVPAIRNDNCTAGRRWKPTNIQCATCLCIVNRFSRCVPEIGCRPSATNGTGTATLPPTEATTVSGATGATSPTTVAGAANNPPPVESNVDNPPPVESNVDNPPPPGARVYNPGN